MDDDKKEARQIPTNQEPMTVDVGTRTYTETPITVAIMNSKKVEKS